MIQYNFKQRQQSRTTRIRNTLIKKYRDITGQNHEINLEFLQQNNLEITG